jgi:hypothetical protein
MPTWTLCGVVTAIAHVAFQGGDPRLDPGLGLLDRVTVAMDAKIAVVESFERTAKTVCELLASHGSGGSHQVKVAAGAGRRCSGP